MFKHFIQGMLLLGAVTIATGAAAQAAPGREGGSPVSGDVAVMFAFEHAQVAQTNGNKFWAKGILIDSGISMWKGIGFAFDLSMEHASNIQNGVDLNKFAFMAGPRYTFRITPSGFHGNRPVRAFVQTLYGPTHATALFPETIPLSTSAQALSVSAGGGIDIPVKAGLGIRAIDASWIHSNYSNNAQDIQNDFRLAFGASYHF